FLGAGDVAEAAAAGAGIPHHHHGRRASAPAFSHVGAEALLADGVQLQLLERLPDLLVGGPAGQAHLEPFRLALLLSPALGRSETDQVLRHRFDSFVTCGAYRPRRRTPLLPPPPRASGAGGWS